MSEYAIFPLGDQAVTFSLGNTIQKQNHHRVMAMMHWLGQHSFPGIVDIVVAYNSITILYDLFSLHNYQPGACASDFVSDVLLQAYRECEVTDRPTGTLKKIPVCYHEGFAPDMEFMMKEKNLSRDEVVALHTGRTYAVYMIGFLPGFPYMAEVDPKLVLPRKPKPRLQLEAGSVGIAGVQTGIYPVVSPGGWQIIGRTPLRLFDTRAMPPVLLEPGDEVLFYAVTPEEFQHLNQHNV